MNKYYTCLTQLLLKYMFVFLQQPGNVEHTYVYPDSDD